MKNTPSITIPIVNNGKQPDEAYNASLSFWLPVDTPYGNFTLKLMKISGRIDDINRCIIESYAFWEVSRKNQMLPLSIFERHVFATEKVVYHMRRTCDELISLIWCLSNWEELNEWPQEIDTDDIFSALDSKQNNPAILTVFSIHSDMMHTLNNISNAFKHSFINTDLSLLGANEPCIHALGLKQNKLNSQAAFHNVSLPQLIIDFDKMYQDAFNWLKNFSLEHRE